MSKDMCGGIIKGAFMRYRNPGGLTLLVGNPGGSDPVGGVKMVEYRHCNTLLPFAVIIYACLGECKLAGLDGVMKPALTIGVTYCAVK